MKIKKRYIYPPRPEHTPVAFENVGVYSRYGWKCQIKVNDLRTTFSVENGSVEFFTRHAEHRKKDTPDYIAGEILAICEKLGFGTSEWTYLDGGILQHKNKHLSGLVALWDVLVVRGDYLLKTTYQSRYDRLAKIEEPFNVAINGRSFDLGLKLSEHIFVPRVWDDIQAAWAFVREVNAAAGWEGRGDGEPALEGCVIKDMSGTLKPGFGENNNVEWCVRSRVHTGRHRN